MNMTFFFFEKPPRPPKNTKKKLKIGITFYPVDLESTERCHFSAFCMPVQMDMVPGLSRVHTRVCHVSVHVKSNKT